MKEKCFHSMPLITKDYSIESTHNNGYAYQDSYIYQNRVAHQNGRKARLVNRGRILMNLTLSLTGLISLYLLYKVLFLH